MVHCPRPQGLAGVEIHGVRLLPLDVPESHRSLRRGQGAESPTGACGGGAGGAGISPSVAAWCACAEQGTARVKLTALEILLVSQKIGNPSSTPGAMQRAQPGRGGDAALLQGQPHPGSSQHSSSVGGSGASPQARIGPLKMGEGCLPRRASVAAC